MTGNDWLAERFEEHRPRLRVTAIDLVADPDRLATADVVEIES
jgi:hypothetical protein